MSREPPCALACARAFTVCTTPLALALLIRAKRQHGRLRLPRDAAAGDAGAPVPGPVGVPGHLPGAAAAGAAVRDAPAAQQRRRAARAAGAMGRARAGGRQAHAAAVPRGAAQGAGDMTSYPPCHIITGDMTQLTCVFYDMTPLQTKLEGLKVFVHQDGAYRPHPTFQKQLMYALSNLGGSPWERGRLQLPKDPENTFAAADLERYARARWDSVLHYMVGSTAVQEPPQSVVDILLRTRLLQASGADSRALHITDTGYEFMLKDIHVQMWIFMLEYIRTLDNTGTLKQEDILQFLFQISYCQTGEYYAVADLTETQRLLLGDFIDFGLLFRKRPNSDRFYTTSLAVNLIFGGSTGQKRSHVSLTSSFAGVRAGLKSQVEDPRQAPTADHSAQLFVVVETNFKIYAYTTSTLHVAMLSVFVDIVARLPNLAIGFITRESLRSALIHGISAQQIYDFLMKHAHPKMRHNTPVIPENIADQIYLWERERNRVQFMEGILFDGFNTKEDYESVRDYAKDLKVLTWSDPIHFRLSIATAGIDDDCVEIRPNVVGADIQQRRRRQSTDIDRVEVLESVGSVIPAEQVHFAVHHHGPVERATTRNAAGRADLAPRVGDQVEPLQVVEAAVRLVHAAEDEHVVAEDHGRVAVSVRRAVAARLHLPPLVRDEAVLVQVVERVASVPASEDDEPVGVRVHDAAVAEASGGHGARGLQAAPALRLNII
ncbi:hypothetical protein ON010_g10603 [Phytophthora cinnamomi]|nr:hypothetical protein ON010_g10603 [Phytophthora cinnamomi]